MSRKVLMVALAAASLAGAACSRVQEQTTAPAPALTAPAQQPGPAATPRPARARQPAPPKPASTPAPAPHPPQRSLPSLINGSASWIEEGQSLAVTRGQPQPVPLFRQAIVLASVRSAVAGSPAAPRAEFLHGRLTLTFTRGTDAEIASAINRALSVPEADRLDVFLPD